MAKSYLGSNILNLPRGIRNNNPGNLIYTSNNKWIGKVPIENNTDANKKFEQFIELRYGIRAMMIDVRGDIARGKNTIESLIHQYAPVIENNTAAYIAAVAQALGLAPTEQIKSVTKTLLISLSKAIVRVENGKIAEQYITNDDYEAAYSILPATAVIPQKKKLAR